MEAVSPLAKTYSQTNSPFTRVETDFLFSWNNRFFFSASNGNQEMQFIINNLILASKTDFVASENHFLLSFSDTPATASFIFSSRGNIFLNESCIPISGNGLFW